MKDNLALLQQIESHAQELAVMLLKERGITVIDLDPRGVIFVLRTFARELRERQPSS